MATIFYVEDSPVEQQVIRAILKPHYDVVLVNSGLEAVQKGKDIKPDLILTDLNMPGLDGYETATKLKAVWPDIPIVALTGDDTDESRKLALAAGCDGWLNKTISARDLLQALKKYLEGYVETLASATEVTHENLAYQQRLVNRLETQVTALTQANAQLTAVQKITQAITQSLDVDEIIALTLDNMAALLQIESLAVFLYNEERKTFELRGQKNFPADYLSALEPIGSANSGDFDPNSEAALTPQIILGVSPSLKYATSALAGFPLRVKERFIGLLYLAIDASAFQLEEQRHIFELISWQLAIAIDKALTHADLQAAYRDLQKLDDLKNQFVRVASHELRTPLTLLIGYTYLIQHNPTEFSEEMLSVIMAQIELLKSIVDRILDVDRLQNNEFLAEFTRIELNQLVQTIVNNFKILANDKKQALLFEPANPSPVIWTDPLKFEAILTNLIMNAIQFTPAGGTVEVSISDNPAGFEVAIKDNGIGIAEEEQKRIFNKFYQVADPLKRTHGGVGLGLSIAQEMAKLCGGVIMLQSEPGAGSVFSYRQPRQAA